MLVRLGGMTFLTDPIFSDTAGPASFLGPRRHVPPGVPLEELPPIDFVVVSHDHYDHMDLPSIAALAKRGARFVVPLEMGRLVREAGGKSRADWWQHTRSSSFASTACGPALLRPAVNDATAGSGRLGGRRRQALFYRRRSGAFDGFTQIAERLGRIDLAALPICAIDPPSLASPPRSASDAPCRLGPRRHRQHWEP